MSANRTAEVDRKTKETQIRVRLDLDGTGKAQVSTATSVAGVVAFGFFYALFIGVCHWEFGWPTSLWFGLSLPVTGLIAHYYWRSAKKLAIIFADAMKREEKKKKKAEKFMEDAVSGKGKKKSSKQVKLEKHAELEAI